MKYYGKITDNKDLVTKEYVDQHAGCGTPYDSDPAMDGVASAGTENAYARGDHVHPSDTSRLATAGGTMSGAIAMGSNKITGLANGTNDGDAVNLGQMNSAISSNTAYFRGSFATKAALDAVAWQTTNPSAANYVTNNDFAIVEDDETHNDECWRYIYVAGTGTGTGWQAQYKINETPLTQAQIAALNSGATTTNIGQISTNQTAIGNLSNNFATTYSASSTYAVGDYAVYNNVFYVCTTAITTAEAWNSAHWSAVSVAALIGNVETLLAAI